MRSAGKDDQLRDDLWSGGTRPLYGSSRSRTVKQRNSSSGTSQRFLRVREYLDSMVEYAREHGYVETIFRHAVDISRNFVIATSTSGRSGKEPQPTRRSGDRLPDLIKIAMIRIHRAVAIS